MTHSRVKAKGGFVKFHSNFVFSLPSLGLSKPDSTDFAIALVTRVLEVQCHFNLSAGYSVRN